MAIRFTKKKKISPFSFFPIPDSDPQPSSGRLQTTYDTLNNRLIIFQIKGDGSLIWLTMYVFHYFIIIVWKQ